MAAIGIFGGTFDPIHLGHLRSAWDVADALSLEAMQFVPSYSPVHRDTPQASVAQRLTMVRLAIADMPNWSVSESEIHRGGPSYTFDTLRLLRAQVGADVPLWLLLGSDAFEGFVRWHRWQEILQLANLAVMIRAGVPPVGCVETQRLLLDGQGECVSDCAGQIKLVPVTVLGISATQIRQAVREGLAPHFLVMPTVCDYIRQQGLYQGNKKNVMDSKALADLVVKTLDDSKAKSIVCMDVRGLSNVADFMLIATATSNRHGKSSADKVWEASKEAGNVPIGMEGEESGEWVLLDLGDVVVHVMLEQTRALYQLEKLWDMKTRPTT